MNPGCEQCNDTRMVLIVENGRNVAKQCPCLDVIRLEKMLERCGLPPRYQKASFETFEQKGMAAPIRAACLIANRYVEEFPTDPSRGLLFVGPVGVGKTHLAIAILRKLTLDYQTRTHFADFRDLLNKIKATFDGGTATRADVLRPAMEAEALVIDELGAARVTDWTFEVAEEIINHRYNTARATIFTTNLPNLASAAEATPAKARGGYGALVADAAREETLGDRLGARMFSRVQQMCRAVEVTGDDYRRRPTRI
jgi:DNA replication protein DnaC